MTINYYKFFLVHKDFTPNTSYWRLGSIFLNLFLTKQHLNMFKRWCEWGIDKKRSNLIILPFYRRDQEQQNAFSFQ